MSYWIVSLISLLSGFAGAAYLFSRYHLKYSSHYHRQALQLKESKEALQKIMYRTHHHGINPISKRIRGLSGLGMMGSARLMNYLEMLSKPNHQKYSKLAMAESLEIMRYLKLIEKQALDLENDVLSNIKEFEHLQ
ncbi:MAG: hypothetical protein ACRC1W_01365 [Shewanella sp.]